MPTHIQLKIRRSTIVGLHYNFILFQYALTQIYLGRSHICRLLFSVILGRRKKGLRNADVNLLMM